MRKRYLSMSVALFVISTVGVARGQMVSHCQKGEVTYFSCGVPGSKIVSLCGSPLSNSNAERPNSEHWLQYRFGKLGRLELVYPKELRESVRKFEGESRHGLGVSLDALSFSNGGVKYVLESSSSTLTGESFDGVRIYRGGQHQPISLWCERLPIGDGDFRQLADQLDPAPR